MDFDTRDERCFHFGFGPRTLFEVFPTFQQESMAVYVKKLVSLCVSLQDNPNIRFQSKR